MIPRRRHVPFAAPVAALAIALAALALLSPAATGAGIGSGADCGTGIPCRIEGGEYRIRLPRDWDGKTRLGAIVFLHGWRGSAEAEMRNPAWERLADRLGVAFVAPQGEGGTWSYPGAPRQLRDEFAFFETLVDDLTTRFALRRDRLMVTGFSMGGSMVWNIACHRGDLFAGYAPIAGAFWDPVPQTCRSSVPALFHVHGTSDRTVPLEGRPIGDAWRQSDVAKSLAVWQDKAGLPHDFPQAAPAEGLACQRQEARSGSGLLEVCLHKGGHAVRAEWVERAWRALGNRLGWDL